LLEVQPGGLLNQRRDSGRGARLSVLHVQRQLRADEHGIQALSGQHRLDASVAQRPGGNPAASDRNGDCSEANALQPRQRRQMPALGYESAPDDAECQLTTSDAHQVRQRPWGKRSALTRGHAIAQCATPCDDQAVAPPSVSVIIPAYRAQATLPLVLRSLETHVVGRDREVILVDSTEATDGMHPLAQDWPWVRVVSIPRRMLPGRARNLGASLSRGDLLAFLDADTIPEPGWLDELEHALGPGVEMVSGAVLDGTPDNSWGTVGYMLEFLEWVPERSLPLGHAVGCNLLIRRAAFERAGGFPEDLWPGEDTVFSVPFAANGTLAFAPRAQVTHMNRVGRRAVLTHQRRLGASWVGVCARVSVPGSALAVPHLAPVAVLGRFYSIVKQLLRYPSATRRLAWHAPLLVAGLVAWGVGVWRASGAQRLES
jgi:hypothetical protein